MKGFVSKNLQSSIEYLKGVGPHKADILKKEIQVFSFEDLLFYFPYKYIDKTRYYSIRELSGLQHPVQFKGQIVQMNVIGMGRKQRLSAIVSDGSGQAELLWFKGVKWWAGKLKPGTNYAFFGKPNVFKGKVSVAHPEVETDLQNQTPKSIWQPVYNTTDKMKRHGLDSKQIEVLIKTIFENVNQNDILETLPEYMIQKFNLPNKYEALKHKHFPTDLSLAERATKRLKYEELFYNQFRSLFSKHIRKVHFKGHVFKELGDTFNQFYENNLPFELTNAQKRVIKEIRKDFLTGQQMNRLLQGDVGSGKTLVALMVMLIAIDNGYQSCIMAPTEILAKQHFLSLQEFLKGLPLKTVVLTGSTKSKEKKQIKTLLENGDIDLLIGTHALIEDSVIFKNLGLVVIDEQHRFGVAQRAKLWRKNDPPPHILVMTATPIPRTLALTQYGELDVSMIDELPPGRKEISTFHATDGERLKLFGFMKREIEKGRQIYVVYPLIKESEKMDYKDLEDGFESISRAFPLPEYQVGIIHGQMKAETKDYEMKRFAEGHSQILVATTVIEVGVNVPNASVMVIESAERFGLSQLHQLRGRVGRGAEKSYCILMTKDDLSQDARKRIQTMTQTTDGFKIAEADLELRGGGDLDGTRQSGAASWIQVNLSEDYPILKTARDMAEIIMEKDPLLKDKSNQTIRWVISKTYREQEIDWSKIS
ncbi:MAG: ATP-dependent DNA helicase RecG [Chitinophagaceae bacterium]|nr:MAG: ATP-dependent DNA helicase RecG [Chitinophagaceae bacterium]